MTVLRANAEGLVPVELSQEVIQGVVKGSTVMSLSRIEEMTTSEKKINVLEGVQAFYVDENEKISNSDATFRPVTLRTKKLAVIVPVSNELLNESIVDVFGEIQTQAVEQFYRKFDSVAVSQLLAKINASGQKVAEGAVAGQEAFQDVSDVMALVEAHGYDVNGFLTHFGMKNKIRKMKDNNGNSLYVPSLQAGTPDQFYSQPIGYSFGVDKANTELIAGDFRYSVVGLQGQLKYKLLTEATVNGVNLAENDLSAIRLILPVAYEIVKDDAFAALTPKAV
jgi:HK97 family phage major capsid protein